MTTYELQPTNWWRVVAVVVAALLCTAAVGYIRERATSRDLAESEQRYRGQAEQVERDLQSVRDSLGKAEAQLRASAEAARDAEATANGLADSFGAIAVGIDEIDIIFADLGEQLRGLASEIRRVSSSSQP